MSPPPLPRTETLLRRAVLDLRVSERRRSFAPVLHVGVPGATSLIHEGGHDQSAEHGLRADLVAALLHRSRTGPVPPLVWLTRTGELVLEDVDAAWLSAARAAYAEAGLPLVMAVVTRRGWWEPLTERSREWKRLRRR